MITLSNVTKRFGSITALDDLSLEVAAGEIFGLLGPNGAGKTTLINIVLGLIEPDSGSVLIGEGGLGARRSRAARASIGVAPQSVALYDELTADENLRFFGRTFGLAGGPLRDRVEWALRFSGLTDRGKHRVATYSGGMKRRLNIAAAMIHDPRLILLDEPTVGVDPQSRNAIFESILELKQSGRTIVYTTHYMEEAERLCDRVAVIDHGRPLAVDAVDGLLKRFGGPNVLVAETPRGEVRLETADPVEALVRLRRDGGLGEFRIERPDLETVFLKLTGRHLRD